MTRFISFLNGAGVMEKGLVIKPLNIIGVKRWISTHIYMISMFGFSHVSPEEIGHSKTKKTFIEKKKKTSGKDFQSHVLM